MSDLIRIFRDGREYGPYSMEEVGQHLATGGLISGDLAWKEGMSEWRPLSELIDTSGSAKSVVPISGGACNTVVGMVPRLWNPNVAANWCVLFGTAFGAWLHAANWRELGEFDKAAASMRWFWVSLTHLSIVQVGLMVTGPGSEGEAAALLTGYLGGFAILVSWFLSAGKKQIRYVKESYGQSYSKKTWISPLAIGTTCLVTVSLLSWISSEPKLPEVDSPEVLALAERIVEESLVGQLVGEVTIANAGELSFDRARQRRVARAELKSSLGREVIYYSVEWQNREKGMIWVQLMERP